MWAWNIEKFGGSRWMVLSLCVPTHRGNPGQGTEALGGGSIGQKAWDKSAAASQGSVLSTTHGSWAWAIPAEGKGMQGPTCLWRPVS